MNQIECKIFCWSFYIFMEITFYVSNYDSSFYNYSSVYTEKYRWLVKPTNKYVHDEWMTLKFLTFIILCFLTILNFLIATTTSKLTYSSTVQPTSMFTMNQIEYKILRSSFHIFKDITIYVFNYNSSFYKYSNVYTGKDRWHVNSTNRYVHDEWMLKFLTVIISYFQKILSSYIIANFTCNRHIVQQLNQAVCSQWMKLNVKFFVGPFIFLRILLFMFLL